MNLNALLYATFNLCMLDSSRARDVPPIHWYLVGVSGHVLQAKSVLQNFPVDIGDRRQLASLPRPVIAAKNTRIVRIECKCPDFVRGRWLSQWWEGRGGECAIEP